MTEKVPGLPHEELEEFFSGGFTTRDEANAIVARAFRNGPLEDLHAGRLSRLLDDSSLSRITDDEMKELMIRACDVVEQLLRQKSDDPAQYWADTVQYAMMYCLRWKRD